MTRAGIKRDPVVSGISKRTPLQRLQSVSMSDTQGTVKSAVSNGILPPSFPLPVRLFRVLSGLSYAHFDLAT